MLPPLTEVARPLLLIVATDGVEDCQVVCVVTSIVEPSEYCTMAAYCWVVPLAIEADEGVTTKPVAVTGVLVIVSAPELVKEPSCAWIDALPGLTPVASPELFTVALLVDEVQVTAVLRFCVEPSV